jgi:PadR family transcriptional regulator PadR
VGHLGELEQLILFAVTALGDDAYGGAIRAHIEERSGRIVSSGAINTTLGRLAERRLVSGRVGAPAPGRAGRPRKYYALTPAGARDLQKSYTAIRAMAGDVIERLDRLAEQDN